MPASPYPSASVASRSSGLLAPSIESFIRSSAYSLQRREKTKCTQEIRYFSAGGRARCDSRYGFVAMHSQSTAEARTGSDRISCGCASRV